MMASSSGRYAAGLEPLPRLPGGTAAILFGLPIAALLGALAALHPEWWRALLAAVLTLNGLLLAVRWPAVAAVVTLLFLPFLALIRRLLIADAGWTGNDPLLLVAPSVALFLCYRIFVLERRQLASDLLSRLVLVLLGFAVFGAINPLGTGGILGGVGGLLFIGVPLLWFFIGRELPDRKTVEWLMQAVVCVAVAIAAYGLYQTELGSLPPWDAAWHDVAGFSGLTAGESETGHLLFRPWGTFSSTSEYAGYLSIGLMIAIALFVHRRLAMAVAIPVLAFAVFLAGGRSVLALTLVAGLVLVALRTRNVVVGVLVVVLGAAAMYGAAGTIGPTLDRAAGLSGDPKVERQVGGLLNPLDPDKSTFLSHWENLGRAVKEGFANPIGSGTGATNLGARIGGGGTVETDIDVGDVFVSFGFVAGFVFIAIIVVAFRAVCSRYLAGGSDPLIFAVVGVLVVTLGQWLQGGHYAASALTWFLLGWAVRPAREGPTRRGVP